MRHGIIALILTLAVPGVAAAGTNFPSLADYPAPSCAKPGEKPVMARDTPHVVNAGGVSITTGAKDAKDYNKQVDQYNVALQNYTVCMNAYVDNAQADMNAIKDKVNKAVEQGKVP
jgi:hypothetical protein